METRSLEYSQIIKEYSHCLKSVRESPHCLTCTTYDVPELTVKAEWTPSGWLVSYTVCSETWHHLTTKQINEDPYETFESGLMKLSSSFAARFHQRLTEKLKLFQEEA